MPLRTPVDIAKQSVLAVQDYSLLSWRAVTNVGRKPHYGADIMRQADLIGVGSIPIVVLTGFFTGAVLALQTSTSLAAFGASALTGQLVALSMIQELGPVLTARSEEHTSELQSRQYLVCRLLLEKKKKINNII